MPQPKRFSVKNTVGDVKSTQQKGIVKLKQSTFVALNFQNSFVLIFNYGHESWVMIERVRSQVTKN